MLLLDSDTVVKNKIDFISYDGIIVSDTQLHMHPIE